MSLDLDCLVLLISLWVRYHADLNDALSGAYGYTISDILQYLVAIFAVIEVQVCVIRQSSTFLNDLLLLFNI